MVYLKFYLVFLFLAFCNNICDTINVKLIPEYIWDRHLGKVAKCDIPCEFSAEPENPDAEFYISMNDDYVRKAIGSNSNNKIKILGSLEPQHYYHLHKIEFLKQHFQATSLLDRRSDIPWVMMPNMDSVKSVEMPKDPKPHATFVARNCHPKNNRNEYVEVIDAVIGVFAPSNCFHNMEWPKCDGRDCSKVEAIKDYKIHLSFENGDSPGFITDKIYQPMEAGVLPVWMGTVDIADVVPKGSYVDVADFDTPRDVANYLKKLLENETMYHSYFEWKQKPFDPEFEAVNRVLWEVDHFCRVCHYVDAVQRGVEWDHSRQRAVDRIPGNVEVTTEKTGKGKETGPTNQTDAIKEVSSGNETEGAIELDLEINKPRIKHFNSDAINTTAYFSMSFTFVMLIVAIGLVFMCKKVCDKST